MISQARRPLHRRPLYDEFSLVAASRIYLVEGQQAAAELSALGLCATTSTHAARALQYTDWRPLAGKEVIVLPANDPLGAQFAAAAAVQLARLQPPVVIKWLTLPDLCHQGDITDFLADHLTEQLPDLRRAIEKLADAAPLWSSESGAAPLPSAAPQAPILKCLADIESRDVSWLWPGRLALRRVSLLVGRPGEGKSLLAADIAARVSTGAPWPDGLPSGRGSVIMLSAEDDPSDTIRPRLEAHQANLGRIHLLPSIRTRDSQGDFERGVTLSDADAIEQALRAVPDCQLIIVDPLGSFIGRRVDTHRDNAVRSVLEPIARLADRYGPAVLVVAHRRKGGSHFADDTPLGSRAFTGLARAVWHVARDSEEPGRRLLLPGKNNLAPEGAGLAFTIQGQPPRLVWSPESISISASDALHAERAPSGPEALARRDASDWLRNLLAGRSLPTCSIRLDAEAAGYAWRTIERAKVDIGALAKRCSDGLWLWSLPSPT